jgi:hypothetical protein
MEEFNVRSDSVDVDEIMRQIRARIREKRGADYTEQELQQLAQVKLERFIDPKGIRSDLVQQFRRHVATSPSLPNFAFDEQTLYETHRGPVAAIRRLLRPILKLFFNPDRLTAALHIQSQVNEQAQERLARQEAREALTYEVIHNLTVEVTRLGIETHNLKMRVESLSSRLDFSERRARSMEGLTPARPAPQRPPRQQQPPPPATAAPVPGAPESAGPLETGGGRPDAPAGGEEAGTGERRRRRRRRRRRPGQTLADRQAGAGTSGESSDEFSDQDRDQGDAELNADQAAERADNGWSDDDGPSADAGSDNGGDDGTSNSSDPSDSSGQ